jgi:hypothetical protein
MTDLNCKIFKLTSGETIIGVTDDNCENLYDKKSILVMDPVLINQVRIPRGDILVESYILLPWISLASNPLFEISTTQILTTSDVKEHLKASYNEYITSRMTEENSNSEKDKSNAEEIIEEIFNSLGEENEEEAREEFSGGNTGRVTRTLH